MYDPPKAQTNFDDVGDFHEKFDLDNTTHHDSGPRSVPRDVLEFRMKFLLEEVLEFILAAGYEITVDPSPQSDRPGQVKLLQVSDEMDHAGMFDALLDEAYVVFGTAHLLGYPWQQGWDLVQRANMTKVRAQSAEESKRGSSFDVVKPPGWIPPNIDKLLAYQGWYVESHTEEETQQ